MTRRHADEVMDDSELDAQLAQITSSDWGESYAPPVELSVQTLPAVPGISPMLPPSDSELPAPTPEGEDYDPEDSDADAEHDSPVGSLADVGLLADLAMGAKNAEQAAAAAGISVDELRAKLAVNLRDVPPDELAKAMGLQAAQQQLKSGAIYGVVLSVLVDDLLAGRMKSEHKLELAKILAKMGRIEPKEDRGQVTGSGFVLNIVLPGEVKPLVIEASPVTSVPEDVDG